MNHTQALAYIQSFYWKTHTLGLDRIRQLLEKLGNPQRDLKFIHVAGTNGKGSVCAMLAAVLQAAGYRVGLNTSPHLVKFEERIQINGTPISQDDLADLATRIRPAADSMEEHPTEFELITAMALVYFLEKRCDIVVLETGLGGALDASNVIDTPEVAVLTAMGMDHMAVLGSTMEEIAAAKAGIIKHGGVVVSSGGCPEADQVFRRTCREQHAQLVEVDMSRLCVREQSLTGTRFDFAPCENLLLPLAGSYQLRNAATAITTVEVLRQQGWDISHQALRQGIAGVRWPGRLECLREKDPTFLLDGAHNVHGIKAVTQSLRELFPGRKMVFLLGILADKEVGAMLDLVVPLAERVVTVTPPESPRAMNAQELQKLVEERGIPAHACASVADGVRAAVQAAGPGGMVCALGSLYMSGNVRQAVETLL